MTPLRHFIAGPLFKADYDPASNRSTMAEKDYNGFYHFHFPPADLKPNLSFLSKLVKCVAVSCFVRHAKENGLFPVR